MHILDNNVTSGYSFYRIDFKRFYFVHILMSSVGLRKFTTKIRRRRTES